MLGVGYGGFVEYGCRGRLIAGARTATSIADNACEIVQEGPKGMGDGIVIEPFGMHLPQHFGQPSSQYTVTEKGNAEVAKTQRAAEKKK